MNERTPPTEGTDVPTWTKLGLAVLGAAGLAVAGRSALTFTGDAVLHLVLAESLAEGRGLAFNPGGAIPADALSSSLLWTALGALGWRLGGPLGAMILLKLVGWLAWLGLGFLAYRCARRAGAAPAGGWFAAVLAAALPGTAENAGVGLENGLAAALVLAVALLMLQLPPPGQVVPSRLALLGAVAGLAWVARPEGVLAVAWLAMYLFARARPSDWSSRALAEAAGVLGLATLIGMVPWLAHAQATGQLLPGSALARAMRARRDPLAFTLSGLGLRWLWVHPRPLLRLLAYGPLLVLAVAGARASRQETWVLALAGLGASLYALVGAVHTGRYLIWVFALLAVVAGVGWDAVRLPRGLRAVALAALAATACLEAGVRLATQTFAPTISQVVRAWSEREARTTRLLGQVCGGGCCPQEGPIDLAAVEIEARFALDDRVRVFSLEGLTRGPDGERSRFDPDGCPQLEAIFKDPRLVADLDPPDEPLQGCRSAPQLDALRAAWDEVEGAGDWRYDPSASAVVRQCRRGAQRAGGRP